MNTFIDRKFVSFRYDIYGVSGQVYTTDPITWGQMVITTEQSIRKRVGVSLNENVVVEVLDIIRAANLHITTMFNFSGSRDPAINVICDGMPVVLNRNAVESITLKVEYPNE